MRVRCHDALVFFFFIQVMANQTTSPACYTTMLPGGDYESSYNESAFLHTVPTLSQVRANATGESQMNTHRHLHESANSDF